MKARLDMMNCVAGGSITFFHTLKTKAKQQQQGNNSKSSWKLVCSIQSSLFCMLVRKRYRESFHFRSVPSICWSIKTARLSVYYIKCVCAVLSMHLWLSHNYGSIFQLKWLCKISLMHYESSDTMYLAIKKGLKSGCSAFADGNKH